MINNRQNNRRRGRGGGSNGIRPNGQNNGMDRGNRIDNRARGNANQLFEKYKTLARDAQTQGDRVMAEYYLQFSDHYFRILNENRARFEDQQQQRRGRDDQFDRDDQDDFEDDGNNSFDNGNAPPRQSNENYASGRDQPQRQNGYNGFVDEHDDGESGRRDEPQRGPSRREARPPRGFRQPSENGRGVDEGNRDYRPEPAAHRPEAESAPSGELPLQKPAARGRRRQPREEEGQFASEERIEMDRLPPSFSLADEPVQAAPPEDAPAPKRRGRPPRASTPAIDA